MTAQPDREASARLRQALNVRGRRMTSAREAVLAVLVAGGAEHLTAAEIAARVQETAPQVHRSSTHRALELLVRMGAVQHVHAGHSPVRYHLRANGRDHLHLQCSQCHTIFDLPGDLMDELAQRLSDEHGFELDPGHVALSGTCPSCQQPARDI